MTAPEEKAGAIERLENARSSSDLGLESGKRKDADFLIASGIALRKAGYGSVLYQLQNSTQTELRRVADQVIGAVRYMNMRQRWRLNDEAIRKVSYSAIAHHISPSCQYCKGTGREPPSRNPCKHCGGSGKHPLPKKNRDAVAAVIAELERKDSFITHEIARLSR